MIRKISIPMVAFALGACSSESSPMDTGGNNQQDGGTTNQDAAEPMTDAGPPDLTCDPDFGRNDACAGDVVATWTYNSACTNDTSAWDAVRQTCPTATVMNGARSTGGTLTFTAGGMFTRMANDQATTNFMIPTACNPLGCAATEQAIEGAAGNTQATCTQNAGGGCDCTATTNIATNDTGTYTVDNGVITATPTGGQAGAYDYCVRGNVLKYRGQPGNAHNDFVTYVLTK